MIFVNSAAVGMAVLVHYESLSLLNRFGPRVPLPQRSRIVLGVFGTLVAHAIEVWLFAFVFYFMHHTEGWGELTGNATGSLLDCVYYSFTTFSTLGYGDIVPVGDVRYLTGIVSLTGLVLVTWSASFLFLEMQRYWKLGR